MTRLFIRSVLLQVLGSQSFTMRLYGFWFYITLCVIAESPPPSPPPPHLCTTIRTRHGSHTHLQCNIPDNYQWTFRLVQSWAQKHKVQQIQVYIKCKINGRIILRQPIKCRGMTGLYIETCNILHFYRYDLSRKGHLVPFTLKTMEIIDSTYVITYRELQKLYTEHSEEVNAKYPCFIPPSLERYVERNISVVSNTNGHVNLDAKERHHQNIPICNYTQLNYYEKSLSTTDKSRFVNKFLSKGNFPSLRVLNLSYLYLKRAPEKLCKDRFLEEFPALQFVDLSHNRLSDIEFGTFGDLREQVSFDMGHNNIRVVSATVLSTLRTIYPGVMVLRGNPFSCRCDQKDLFQFLKNSAEPLVTHYRYLLSVRCKTPLKYRGRLLGDVPFHNDCYLSDKHSNVLIVVPVVSVTCCVAAFIIYLVYRKCLGCFQCKRPRQNPTEPLLVTSDNFQYDAFISYSQEDETLVKMMCGRLEGPPYNAILCLHNRHFIPGVSIIDNIFQAVESSRHTVVVLSEHFLESHWCMTEFREANRKGILDNKRHLVAIVMEEFDDHVTSLPQELSMFLKTHTYIRVSELNFWEKLVNAINKYTTDEDASGISSVKSNAAGKDRDKRLVLKVLSCPRV